MAPKVIYNLGNKKGCTVTLVKRMHNNNNREKQKTMYMNSEKERPRWGGNENVIVRAAMRR